MVAKIRGDEDETYSPDNGQLLDALRVYRLLDLVRPPGRFPKAERRFMRE
jgi:hypothetical protein